MRGFRFTAGDPSHAQSKTRIFRPFACRIPLPYLLISCKNGTIKNENSHKFEFNSFRAGSPPDQCGKLEAHRSPYRSIDSPALSRQLLLGEFRIMNQSASTFAAPDYVRNAKLKTWVAEVAAMTQPHPNLHPPRLLMKTTRSGQPPIASILAYCLV